MIEKARQDLETNIRSSDKSEYTIEAEAYISHSYMSLVTGIKYIPRGERDVIRLRNPTEDERAFRRVLKSADHLCTVFVHKYGRRKSTKTSEVRFFYKSSCFSLES